MAFPVAKVKRWPLIGKYLVGIIQWGCGFKGHEPDFKEWGYGGGDHADSWCSRCGKMIQVPKTSVWFRNREAQKMMGALGETGGCE